jgi:hypothetical protein
MLSLDDAVKVAKRLIADNMDDDEIIRQEMEQKCWFPPKTDTAAIDALNGIEFCQYLEFQALRLQRQPQCRL